MIKTIKAILAPITIATVLFSCKKDNTDNNQPNLVKNEAAKVQVWFGSQPNISTAKLPAATALYANTVTYAGSGIAITPMQLAGTTSQVAGKFLVTDIDAAGNITGGNFYIVLNKTNPSAGIPVSLVTPGFLSLSDIPEAFTGGIIKYNMAGNMLSSVHIEAGKVMNGQQDILSTTKLKPADGSTTNLAPPPSGQTCTDWYYQHFENGILIWEEYLFTSCEDTSGQGGGGTSNTDAEAAWQAFLNSGHSTSVKISESILYSNRTQRKKQYDWKFYELSGFGNYKLYSREWGTQELQPNGKWKFISLEHNSDWKTGNSTNWLITYNIATKTPTIGMGALGYWASMKLEFDVHYEFEEMTLHRYDDKRENSGCLWNADQGDPLP